MKMIHEYIVPVIIIVVIIIVLIAARGSSATQNTTSNITRGCPFSNGRTRAPLAPNGKSLYERLGGIFPITAVVNRFSDAVIDNPLVGRNSPNPYLRDWSRNQLDRLPGLKWMRALWVADVSGGPYTFIPTVKEQCPLNLSNAHAKFQISPAEFDAVAEELSKALDYYKVPAQEKSEVLAAFAAHKGEVNTGYLMAHDKPIPPSTC